MSEAHETTPAPTPANDKPRKPWRRIAIATLIGGLVAGVGFKAFAHGGHGCHGGPGAWRMGMGAEPMDPEAMKQRIEAMVKWRLSDLNATEAQRKRIADIATAALTDFRPLREKHQDARKSAMELLSKQTVDRAALEAVRAQEMQLAETLSKRMTQAIADAAEVLTPEQRVKLAEQLQSRRGWRRG